MHILRHWQILCANLPPDQQAFLPLTDKSGKNNEGKWDVLHRYDNACQLEKFLPPIFGGEGSLAAIAGRAAGNHSLAWVMPRRGEPKKAVWPPWFDTNSTGRYHVISPSERRESDHATFFPPTIVGDAVHTQRRFIYICFEISVVRYLSSGFQFVPVTKKRTWWRVTLRKGDWSGTYGGEDKKKINQAQREWTGPPR